MILQRWKQYFSYVFSTFIPQFVLLKLFGQHLLIPAAFSVSSQVIILLLNSSMLICFDLFFIWCRRGGSPGLKDALALSHR